jgi:hypothetical protein
MDKALPSGGRDCGFESRLGLPFLSLTESDGWTGASDERIAASTVDEQ